MTSMIDAIRAAAVKPRQMRLGVSIPDDLVVFVKQVAKEAGVTQSDVVTYAITLHRERTAAPSERVDPDLRALRTEVAFLRSCVRSGERLNAEDDARIDAILAATEAPRVRMGTVERRPGVDLTGYDEREIIGWTEEEATPDRAAVAAPSDNEEREAGIDVERLRRASVEVEAGYINAPDRTARAYWSKVVAAYDRATPRPR